MDRDLSAANDHEMKVLADALMRKCPEMFHLLSMLLQRSWNNWKDVLRHLRATDPTNPTPAEWAEFRDYAFRVLKERGEPNAAAALASLVQFDAKAAASAPDKVGSPAGIGKVAAERKSEREPAAIENRPKTFAASSSNPALRKAAFGTTKAEVLTYAKARLEAGASPREVAEILACAHEDFHASRRESGRTVGRHHTWVSRLLRWHRDGCKPPGPFGPTTRAGRAALRKHKKNDSGGSAEQLDVDGYIGSPAQKPPKLPASVNGNLPRGSTQAQLPPKAPAAASETKEPKTQTDPLEALITNQIRASVANNLRSNSCRPKNRGSLQSFRPSACSLSSRPSESVPSSATPPPKQAFTSKHFRIGCNTARLATMVTTSCGRAIKPDFTNIATTRSKMPSMRSAMPA